MQVYRGMDIGTGKVPIGERIVPHFGLDLVDPGEAYSAALFQSYGRRIVDMLALRNTGCIICGGTGFYIRAVVDAFEFPAGEQIDNPIREKYQSYLRAHGAEELWLRLFEVDPESAQLIPKGDTKRVIRAFELLGDNTSYAQQRKAFASIPEYYQAIHLGLSFDPDSLRERIDQRVDMMFEQGLIGEVEGLLKAGFKKGITAREAIGYKEVVAYLENEVTLDQAKQAIKTATHRYAKRQRTWFRKDKRILWLKADGRDTSSLINEALCLIDDTMKKSFS